MCEVLRGLYRSLGPTVSSKTIRFYTKGNARAPINSYQLFDKTPSTATLKVGTHWETCCREQVAATSCSDSLLRVTCPFS